jgi:hypothetical protein
LQGVNHLDPERKQQSARAALRAFFSQEKTIIDRNLDGLRDLLQKNSAQSIGHDLRAEASYIHDFYNSAENLFRIVAEELNGGIPRGDSWHRLLLLEMKSEIPGIRKPVISEQLYRLLDTCLRFRHLFRNSYGVFLDPKKTREAALMSLDARDMLLKEFDQFIKSLGE